LQEKNFNPPLLVIFYSCHHMHLTDAAVNRKEKKKSAAATVMHECHASALHDDGVWHRFTAVFAVCLFASSFVLPLPLPVHR
jgi:hypothetical protein